MTAIEKIIKYDIETGKVLHPLLIGGITRIIEEEIYQLNETIVQLKKENNDLGITNMKLRASL